MERSTNDGPPQADGGPPAPDRRLHLHRH
jgi:hypothetical protein